MKRILLIIACVIFTSFSLMAQKAMQINSPDGKLKVSVFVDKIIEYQVFHDGDHILDKSPISMTLDNDRVWGVGPRLKKTSKSTVDEMIEAAVYKKNNVKNHYNEIKLEFHNNYTLVFRAYDDGMAYRFETSQKPPFLVKTEQVCYNFPTDQMVYIGYSNRGKTIEEQFFNSFENTYAYNKLSEWNSERIAFTPVLTENVSGKKVALMESDLLNYPGMFLHNTDGSTSLKGIFAPYPNVIEQGGHNMLQGMVKSRKDYIARFDEKPFFPWRALIVTEKDEELLDNDMIYKLASPAHGDYSWVKPGKVAWEWWNAWNLYDVDFVTGVNNETYKYYIDFASQYGIEYVILDEGWSVNLAADLYQVVPEIDLQELVAYGKERNVGLILWAGYYALEKDIEGICKHYSEMGIKGFKVDFMDRDDQPMVKFHTDVAEIAACYKLLLDYHGSYKPTGLHHTYPNVINFEAVHGLEQMKWASPHTDQVIYDVTMPFIRQLAGPVDYTQGAMRNATRGNFRAVDSEAMSQGTRCRQLAQYVIFESPLNMLCDNPSNYMREEECTRFIAEVPTVWDETKVLNGEVGKHITIARKKGSDWYIGSMTDWNERTLELDLSFLGDGNYKAEVFRDGVNASRVARDYKREIITVPSDRRLTVKMASGGGCAIRIKKIQIL